MLPANHRVLLVLASTSLTLAGLACVGDGLPPVIVLAPDDSGSTPTPPVTTQPDSAATLDGTAPGCTPDVPFRPAELVAGVSGADHDDQMTLTPDELTIYFTSFRPGAPTISGDIWSATRTTMAAGFGTPRRLAMNTPSVEGDPMLSPDGKYLYFTSNLGGAGNYDIFRLPIALVDDPDGGVNLRQSLTVNTAGSDVSGYLTGDGSLYFVRTLDGKRRIHRAAPSATGFATPAPVNDLPSGSSDQTPVLSPDGLVIYWSSDREDLGTPRGNLDIFVATRSSASAPFVNLRRLDELATTSLESPGWISPDGCRLYFTRHDPSPTGSKGDIFVARRGP